MVSKALIKITLIIVITAAVRVDPSDKIAMTMTAEQPIGQNNIAVDDGQTECSIVENKLLYT